MPAKFQDHDIKSGLRNKRKLSTFLDGVVALHKKDIASVELSYIFCNDAFLLEMNRNFLEHDTYTDIITFDLSEAKAALQGEIYVSVERVKENARQYGATYADELYRVIFHGALHLCGFKDKKKKDQQMMREQEDQCVTLYKKELSK